MRLIQFIVSEIERHVGLVEKDAVIDLTSINPDWKSTYRIFEEAQQAGTDLESYINNSEFPKNRVTLSYFELSKQKPGGKIWVLPPLDHPDPAHCLISGTGLTHTGSASQRNKMHNAPDHSKTSQANHGTGVITDSQKMFEMGLKGGKPEFGKRGIQPEWFYKGTGAILKGHNDFLEIPSFSRDCGEEPEIAGCYIIDKFGVPCRLGFAIGNEWSDHITEKVNYLWLAPSKLRTCSVGPELVTDLNFQDVRGYCRIYRGNSLIYDSGELFTGEANMNNSLANLEDHHFKYPQFRIPGEVHIYYFGTMRLSSGSWSPFQQDDKIQIHFEGMGSDLVNYIKRIPFDSTPVTVRKG
ncbi:MAG: hypothetical protein JXA46_00225 [Dehalococcoidales bacterium]|nr:hypothetical protein [Dehalococcoidales bacterium]